MHITVVLIISLNFIPSICFDNVSTILSQYSILTVKFNFRFSKTNYSTRSYAFM